MLTLESRTSNESRSRPVSASGSPATTPLQCFHLLPLAAVLDAHVVPHGVGVREVPRALGDGTHGTVARVVLLQVAPRLRQRAQRRLAQRTRQPRRLHERALLQVPEQLVPSHLHLTRHDIAYRRVCQRAQRRGICNADSTMLHKLSTGRAVGKPDPKLDIPNRPNTINSLKILRLIKIQYIDTIYNSVPISLHVGPWHIYSYYCTHRGSSRLRASGDFTTRR